MTEPGRHDDPVPIILNDVPCEIRADVEAVMPWSDFIAVVAEWEVDIAAGGDDVLAGNPTFWAMQLVPPDERESLRRDIAKAMVADRGVRRT